MSNPYQLTYHGQVYQPVNATDPNYIQADPFTGIPSPNKRLSFPKSNTITLGPRKVSFQINTLGNTVHNYSSINYTDIIALSEYWADWGFSYTTTEGEIHVISVTIPFDTIAQTDFDITLFSSEQWELIPTQKQNNITNKAFVDAAGNNWYLPGWAKLSLDIATKNQLTSVPLPPSGVITGSYGNFFLTQANIMLQMIRGGVKGTYSYGQTLKRTACVDVNNIGNAFQTQADINYQQSVVTMGTPSFVMSTNDMKNNYIAIPQQIQQQMLPSFSKKITDPVYDQYDIFSIGGWLTKAPTIQSISKNKVVYQQEFEWDEWLTYLYNVNNFSFANYPYITSNNPNGGFVFYP